MNCQTSLKARKFVSPRELVGLPGMPGTLRGVNARAKAQGWEAQKRMGRGGGYEYNVAVLPKETRDALVLRQLNEARGEDGTPVAEPAPIAAEPERKLPSYGELNDEQRAVMTARVVVIREIQRMSQLVSQQQAIEALVAQAKAGSLTPFLAERVARANDRKNASRVLSERTLKRWISDFKKHGERALAPKRRRADMSVPPWAGEFLKRYQRPQAPSVEAAYQLLVEQTEPPHPSIHQVRRFLGKMSPEARERGRKGPRELKAYQPYTKRTTEHLLPNDVWVADGHTFDAEVINPETGQPFRPEVTMIIDWATRRIVGYAINLAEMTMTTLDCLRDALSRVGMFADFYVDNGSGFKNEVVYEVVNRLGGDITHSLPYNSQARGVIERAHQTILVQLAKKMDSYIGADMDPEAANRVHKLSRQQIREGLKPTQIPEWQEFYDRLNDELNAYNFRPHRGLPKIRDLETGRLRHESPMEAWKRFEANGFEAITADPEVVASLVRPQQVRKTHRGLVRINGGTYFLRELVALHGEQVKVAWDYRDVDRVGVFTLEGEHLGEAILDGHAAPAKPKTMTEKRADNRLKGQFHTFAKKVKTVTGQDVEIRTLEPATERTYDEGHIARAKARLLEQQDVFVPPQGKIERYRLWQRLESRLRANESITEQEASWLEHYRKTTEYGSYQRVMEMGADEQPLADPRKTQ